MEGEVVEELKEGMKVVDKFGLREVEAGMEDDGDEDKDVEDDMGVFRLVEDESEVNCDDWNKESNDGRVKGCWEVLVEVVRVEGNEVEEEGIVEAWDNDEDGVVFKDEENEFEVNCDGGDDENDDEAVEECKEADKEDDEEEDVEGVAEYELLEALESSSNGLIVSSWLLFIGSPQFSLIILDTCWSTL